MSVLVVHLQAMGAVLRSTSLLPAIHRKYPACLVTWVTDRAARPLLENNPLIDRVLTTDPLDLAALAALEFDVALVIDKSLPAAAVVALTEVEQIFGFTVDRRSGAVRPATQAAFALWELGLDNHLKFKVNQKSEQWLTHEALDLGDYKRDEYVLRLTEIELKEAHRRRLQWSKQSGLPIVGINTGCSEVIKYKKFTVDYHRRLVGELALRATVVLLGGPQDQERNRAIAEGSPATESPCDRGLRDGLVSTQACDLVISGDSLGMHMAIALQKWVIAWFGPTCLQEVDLYGRGVALRAEVPCSPCWKRDCQKEVMCYDSVSLKKILAAVETHTKTILPLALA